MSSSKRFTTVRRSSRELGAQQPQAYPGRTATKKPASTTTPAQQQQSQPQLNFNVVCCSCATAERLSFLLFDSLAPSSTGTSASGNAGSSQGKGKGDGTKECRRCKQPFCRDCLPDPISWTVNDGRGTLVRFAQSGVVMTVL